MKITNQIQAANKKAAAFGVVSSGCMEIAQADFTTKINLPQKLNSVTAEVLARLLNGQALSQQDATKLMSCTRLGSVVHILRHNYGWNIVTQDETSPTQDGRTATYARYYLPESEIMRMSEQERVAYTLSVFEARKARREGRS